MKTERTVLYRGKVIDLYRDQALLPDGQRHELEIIEHPGGAAAVALDPHGRVCLLRQYRHAAGGWLWELPAGKIDNRELPLHTAQRELAEEAGLQAAQWQALGTLISSPGVFTEVIHLFLATGLRDTPPQQESSEILEVHWVEFEQACAWALNGSITDAKSIIGLLRARAACSNSGINVQAQSTVQSNARPHEQSPV